jgi:hypothetical protein
MASHALDFFCDRRTRLVLSWLILLGALTHRGIQGWVNFRSPDRPDGNDGHTSIDFGGQWLMGRLLVLGHGRELYSRERHLEVAREAYRRDRESPNANDHDAERLVGWYPGPASDPVGGPLYPPVQAFVMAPVALISNPYFAYRVTQAFMLGLVLLAGAGVCYLTRGRWWWSAATAFLLMFSGCRGGISLAQNSSLTVCLLIWGWALIARGRPSWGGVLWGLLAFKPVWAISFLAALLLLRQWRAAFTMCLTGAGSVLLTLPFVGLQSWYDWLHVGQLAGEVYLVDRNWIFLSRDLFGIPRRMFLEFREGRAVEDRPIAGEVGWALWGTVAAATFFLAWWSRRRPRKEGLLPGFVLLGAWLCTYRIMYYDAFVAVVGVVAIFSDPRAFFRRSWWPAASCSVVIVGLMLLFENAIGPLDLEITGSFHGLRQRSASTPQTAPTFYLATGDYYPWDTVFVLLLWGWCGLRLLRIVPVTVLSDAPKSAEGFSDVAGPHE